MSWSILAKALNSTLGTSSMKSFDKILESENSKISSKIQTEVAKVTSEISKNKGLVASKNRYLHITDGQSVTMGLKPLPANGVYFRKKMNCDGSFNVRLYPPLGTWIVKNETTGDVFGYEQYEIGGYNYDNIEYFKTQGESESIPNEARYTLATFSKGDIVSITETRGGFMGGCDICADEVDLTVFSDV